MRRFIQLVFVMAALAGCASTKQPESSVPPFIKPPSPVVRTEPPPTAPASNPGGFYLDDGPGDNPPRNLDQIPDAVPRAEKLHPYANRPYAAMGQQFVPLADARNYRARGVASWYGRRYHGKPTATGEVYDMYQMTAAHPTLPIPSYARVTNLQNNRSVTVRVNDRGPFKHDRIIDLSYVAALKLGYAIQGSAEVEVAAIPAVSATTSESSKVNLQLGAFTTRTSAETFRNKIRNELKMPGDALQILFSNGLYRVIRGPFESVNSAREAATQIESKTKLMPVIVRD
jgi:rare lipoprotein A